MTIREYYENYDKLKKYSPELFGGSDVTFDDFYTNCIAKHISDKLYISNAIAWHKMLMDYTEEKDAVFWVRYHENGPKDKTTGRYQTRRACKTNFKNGFSYVFVSNYDAHEIFNMVRLGVKPDLNEFKELMQNYEFPLHYAKGESCEESDIRAYPNIGSVKGGVLTYGKWYLAHIVGVKSDIYVDSLNKKPYTIDAERLYPRGEMSDWQKEKDASGAYIKNSDGDDVWVRNMDYSLSTDEEKIIKAHFLRFIDPLNYYIVPGAKYQSNKYGKQIGESEYLNVYMRNKYSKIYGAEYKEFEEKALVPLCNEIYIMYGSPVSKKQNNPKQPKPTNPNMPNNKQQTTASNQKSPQKNKYEFEGHEYSSLRKILLSLVKKHCQDNPSITYSDLLEKFNIVLSFNKKPVIRLLSDVSEEEKKAKRVYINDPITLIDGTVIVVNNQVQDIDMPDIIQISKDLGYTLIKK